MRATERRLSYANDSVVMNSNRTWTVVPSSLKASICAVAIDRE